jgi:hypothetical protein
MICRDFGIIRPRVPTQGVPMALHKRADVVFLVTIGFYHAVMTLVVMRELYMINLTDAGTFSFGDGERNLWANSGLLGLLGSLLFFSRKTYVYLITNKLIRIEDEVEADARKRGHDANVDKIVLYQARLIGYYLYLIVRPLGGAAIGPLTAMIILGGLSTLSKTSSANAGTLSAAGIYIIYLFSFIGGYTSSDMFDYLSKAGSRFVAKAKLD